MATCVIHWSSLVEGDEQQSNLRGTLPCMFWIFFSVCQKHNSLPLGPIQPSSPSTKELHGHSYCVELAKDKAWTNLTPC